MRTRCLGFGRPGRESHSHRHRAVSGTIGGIGRYGPVVTKGRNMNTQELMDTARKHKQYIDEHGEDMPEIQNWKWMEPISDNADTRTCGMGPRKQEIHE